MNISLQNGNCMAGGWNRLSGGGLMKSTAQKLERQARRDSQVAFFENQKQNLKNIQCSSPEEVARVLELLHSYEDQIAAARAEYNNAQMMHLMDEAKERGEEIAKAIEKSEPKTAEERKKEAVEEALGINEEKGLLDDLFDQAADKIAESLEDMSESEASRAQDAAQAAEASQMQDAAQAAEASQAQVVAQAAEASQAQVAAQAAEASQAQVAAQAAEASQMQDAAQAARASDAAGLPEPQDVRTQEMLPEYPGTYKKFDAFA